MPSGSSMSRLKKVSLKYWISAPERMPSGRWPADTAPVKVAAQRMDTAQSTAKTAMAAGRLPEAMRRMRSRSWRFPAVMVVAESMGSERPTGIRESRVSP